MHFGHIGTCVSENLMVKEVKNVCLLIFFKMVCYTHTTSNFITIAELHCLVTAKLPIEVK